MSSIHKNGFPLLFLIVPLVVFGCTSRKLDDPQNAARYGDLRQIHEIYFAYQKNHQQPPKQLSDVDKKEYDTLYPGTLKSVKDGKYVVVWGVDVNKDPGKVLAYEKAAPTEGVAVITADGKPRMMSAEELQAALKERAGAANVGNVMLVVARIIPALAALDSLALGVWAVACPDGLFHLLQLPVPPPPPPDNDAFLWTWLGYLSLANALCLTVAAIWPLRHGGIAVVPWVSRLLACGMWLWLLGTHVIAPAREPLWYLLAHDAFFFLALTVLLAIQSVLRRRSA